MNAIRTKRLFDSVVTIIIVIAMLLCIIPFLHLISISLSSDAAVTLGKVGVWPVELEWRAYQFVFQNESLFRSLGFTIVLTAAFTLLSMLMTIAAAYPLT